MKVIRLALCSLLLSAPIRSQERFDEAEKLVRQAREKQVASHPYWHRLLHYKRDVFLRRRSDVDHRDFFLSRKGPTDPSAELDATLRAFFNPLPDDPNTHPQCRFIARYEWLKQELDFPAEMVQADCRDYITWRDKLKVKSVSLMFSSYYLNNPASMYGHTFLKLNASESGSDLLDYTVNYAAEVNVGGVAYPIFGLLGRYRGSFGVMPYYIKVQQYNNMESRDLWEYRLRFNSKEIDRLLRHLWELHFVDKAYYFLNKNCSYELLPLLDIADPRLNLTSQFRYRVLPVDTLVAVAEEPGLVSAVRMRPSHLRKMFAARASLSPDKRKLAKQLALGQSTAASVADLAPEDQAPVLDMAYDLLKFKYGFFNKPSPAIRAREQEILVQRSRLPTKSKAVEDYSKGVSHPHTGHPSGRVGVGFGVTKENRFQEISIRPALRDLADDPAGYLSGSQLEMFHLQVRHEDEGNDFYLNKFSLINIANIPVNDEWVRSPAWKFKLNVEPAFDLGRRPSHSESFVVGGGPGFSWQPGRSEHWKVYGLVEAETAVGHVFRKGYRLGAGGTVGAIGRTGGIGWIQLSASALRYGTGHVGNRVITKADQSFPLGKKNLLRFGYGRDNAHQEGVVSWHRYF